MEDQQLVSPSRQCSSTPVGFDQAFLSKEQCDNTGANPGPGSSRFLAVPSTEFSIEGWRFCDANDIIKNATKELKRFSQNDVQECFQHLYIHWQKYIVAQGDYFEGNVA